MFQGELYAYPGRLTWLSMEAFGKFVSTLMKRLVLCNEQLLYHTASLQHIQKTISPVTSHNTVIKKWYIFLHVLLLHSRLGKNVALLNWLTVKALKKYVKTVMYKIAQGKNNLLQDACEYLQRSISSVPPTILYELRVRTIRHVELTYNMFLNTCFINSQYQEIGTEILRAITHPSVTRLEFAICGDGGSHLDELNLFKMKTCSLSDAAQSQLKNLTVFNIHLDLIGFFECNLTTDPGFYENFRNIEELACNRLAWNRLNSLIPQCKNLKVFHFDASLKIYDVPHILKMVGLEELTFRTRCNDRVTDLLVGLSRTKRSDGLYISQKIKKLGKIWPSPHDVHLLAQNFPSLTSLSLVSCNCDLSPLKILGSLRDLDIQNTEFRYLIDLLKEVGKHLHCFKLTDVYHLDLKHIVETCVNLRCFHLLYTTFLCDKSTETDSQIIQIPDFVSVESLQLKFPSECSLIELLLMKFPNVRKLDLIYIQLIDIPDDLIHIKLRGMSRLETAYIRCFQKDLMFLVQFFEDQVVITNIEQGKLLFYSISN